MNNIGIFVPDLVYNYETFKDNHGPWRILMDHVPIVCVSTNR